MVTLAPTPLPSPVPTPVPTQTRSPGFEGLIAVLCVLGAAYLVLKKRR
jgi:hypothetical protein